MLTYKLYKNKDNYLVTSAYYSKEVMTNKVVRGDTLITQEFNQSHTSLFKFNDL